MLQLATKFAPVRESFELAWQAGFPAAELWLDRSVLEREADVVSLARQYPFRYGLHFPNRTDLSDEHVHAVVRLYRELDCRALVIHEPMARKFAGPLVELHPQLCLAVENHYVRPDDFLSWYRRQPGVALDVEHLWMLTMGDVTVEAVLKEVDQLLAADPGRLQHVHLPGYVPGYLEHRPMYCNRDLVWGIWDRLEQIGFDGLIVSETSLEYQTAENLRMDRLLFESWWKQRIAPPAA